MTTILTRAEEQSLAKTMLDGREAARQQATAAPTDVPMMQAAIKAGEAARQHLITANLPLVAHVVGRRRMVSELGMQDQFQEGVIGLIEAVDRFDPDRGTRLSTYAVPWITGRIQRAIQAEAPLTYSDYAIRQRQRKRQLEQQLTLTLQRQPTRQELATAMGCSVGRLYELQTETPIPLDETSLQIGCGEILLEESLPLDALFDLLHPQEAKILWMRYGLQIPMEKMGEMLGISPRRIRQIAALAKQRITNVAEQLQRPYKKEGRWHYAK
jgi:RNA polymerase sigma factor (sigma-70 family)